MHAGNNRGGFCELQVLRKEMSDVEASAALERSSKVVAGFAALGAGVYAAWSLGSATPREDVRMLLIVGSFLAGETEMAVGWKRSFG